jgi:hypothetical protein
MFLYRDRPVPIPSPGTQLVNLSHVEDLAAMLATVPGNEAAVRQQFNLASDRAITFDGDLSAPSHLQPGCSPKPAAISVHPAVGATCHGAVKSVRVSCMPLGVDHSVGSTVQAL